MAPLWWDALAMGQPAASELYNLSSGNFIASPLWGASRILNKGAYQWGNAFRRRALAASISTVILGVRFQWNGNLPTANWGALLSPYEGTTGHASIGMNTAGVLEVRRGPLSTSTLLFNTGVTPNVGWNALVIKVTVADAGGSFIARLNGTTIANLTGIDTRNGGAVGTVSHIQVGVASNPGVTLGALAEFYALDTTGGYLDDIPAADLAVAFLQPRYDGASIMATSFGGGGTAGLNHTFIDDQVSTGDTTNSYLIFANLNDLDLFILDALPLTAEVYGVMPHAIATLSAAGSRDFRLPMRASDGTMSEGPSYTCAVSTNAGREFGRPMIVDALGNPLTRTELAQSQIGFRRISATGTPNLRLGMLGFDVLMDEPAIPIIRRRWFAPATG